MKKTYDCKICKEKTHLARDCPNNSSKDRSDSGAITERRRALITVSLSATNASKLNQKKYRNFWIQDSGATQHMSCVKECFINYKELEKPTMVLIGDGSEIEGVGVGDINLEAFDSKSWRKIVLKDVLYVPDMSFNLFSEITVLKKGYDKYADFEKLILMDFDDNIAAVAVNDKNLFRLQIRQEESVKDVISSSNVPFDENIGVESFSEVQILISKNNDVTEKVKSIQRK